MAPQKHQQEKLVEVALEGFALLDEFYGRPKKAAGRLPATEAYDHHQIQYNYYNQYRDLQVITIREPVIECNQAAQFYGGMGIVDYRIRKIIRRAYN